MSIKLVETKETEINVGDTVRAWCEGGHYKNVKLVKIIENKNKVYGVFNDGSWRPFSSYNATWRKVNF